MNVFKIKLFRLGKNKRRIHIVFNLYKSLLQYKFFFEGEITIQHNFALHLKILNLTHNFSVLLALMIFLIWFIKKLLYLIVLNILNLSSPFLSKIDQRGIMVCPLTLVTVRWSNIEHSHTSVPMLVNQSWVSVAHLP